MDPENPVVRLCAEGMRAEGEGRLADARALFAEAWEARQGDYDACVAAHFVARHQDTPEETLRWNEEALARADAAGGERVRDFYPSLYLNLAHAHEQMGALDKARRFYARAAELADALPDDRYGGIVRGGIAEGRKRVGAAEG